MLFVTKIFHFEMAHAIYRYPGVCRNIHGHSYTLHVSVSSSGSSDDFIPTPGFEIDFKEIKKVVVGSVIKSLDHKLILSRDYLAQYPTLLSLENLVVWEAEPTAENLLIYIRRLLENSLPEGVKLAKLKIYETKDSYAEWLNN